MQGEEDDLQGISTGPCEGAHIGTVEVTKQIGDARPELTAAGEDATGIRLQ